VAIQSMTKVPTTDIDRCVGQINELVRAGCAFVRVAVPRRADTEAFAQIVRQVSVPLVADIHFSPARAIEAIEGGAAKIRLNPGNIKNREDIHRIIDAAKAHGVAIRVGVNEASIRDLTKEPIPPAERVDLMLAELRRYVRLFEDRGFDRLVLSAKTSDTVRTIEVNRRIAEAFGYPLHLGLTHAGLPEHARIPSAVALGTLLAEGIGDTIRVSAAGDPVIETGMAKEILASLGLGERRGPELIVCPTCGRTEIEVLELARRVEQALGAVEKPCRIAVMGCVVNGPGEAADADFAICAGKDKAYFYRNGERTATVPASEIIPRLLEALAAL
jgi:(E)-4-hydroxy-3-methylbut-2-enyl-diphosphate synthase